MNDIHRTGAKSLLDPLEPMADYHILGAVRTKPGRGDPTSSLSCSDKMAKWCHVGFQGSLLAAFFQRPLIPHTIIVGGRANHAGTFDEFFNGLKFAYDS